MSTAGIKEQAMEDCELQLNGQAQADQKQKRKARLRFYRRVALITACLLIGICMYSVLDPAILGTASSFLGRAKLWFGSVLHVNAAIDIPPPPPHYQEEEAIVEHYDYETIEEIDAAFDFTLYEPTQIPGSMKLSSVVAIVDYGNILSLNYCYKADEDNLVAFIIQPLLGPMDVSFPDDAFLYTAPLGEFTVYESSTLGWGAVILTGEALVSISGRMDKDAFFKMLDTLREVH